MGIRLSSLLLTALFVFILVGVRSVQNGDPDAARLKNPAPLGPESLTAVGERIPGQDTWNVVNLVRTPAAKG